MGLPRKYAGANMDSVHKRRGISSEAFDAVMADFVAILTKLSVPVRESSDTLRDFAADEDLERQRKHHLSKIDALHTRLPDIGLAAK